MIKRLEDLELLDDAIIGTGACSKVVRCRLKGNPQVYALKIVDMQKVSELDAANLKTEIKLHKELNHPSIVRFYDSYSKDNYMYFLMEYCSRYTLYYFIHVRFGLPDVLALRFLYQVALGIQYLHQRNIIHRDIKPENLLMDDNYNLKICDFGWGVQLTPDKPARFSMAGTFEFMAPEVVFQKGHGKPFDMWTLGILLYEMLHGTTPAGADTLKEMEQNFTQQKITYSMKISKPVQDLLNGLLDRDPIKRLTVDQMLAHPVIVQNLQHFKRPLNQEELDILENNNYLNQLREKNQRKVVTVGGNVVDPNKIKTVAPLAGTETIARNYDPSVAPKEPAPRRPSGFGEKNVNQVFNPEKPDLEKLKAYTANAQDMTAKPLSQYQQIHPLQMKNPTPVPGGALAPAPSGLATTHTSGALGQGVYQTTNYAAPGFEASKTTYTSPNTQATYSNVQTSGQTGGASYSYSSQSYSSQSQTGGAISGSTNIPQGTSQGGKTRISLFDKK